MLPLTQDLTFGLNKSGSIFMRSSKGSMLNRVVALYRKAPLDSVRLQFLFLSIVISCLV